MGPTVIKDVVFDGRDRVSRTVVPIASNKERVESGLPLMVLLTWEPGVRLISLLARTTG